MEQRPEPTDVPPEAEAPRRRERVPALAVASVAARAMREQRREPTVAAEFHLPQTPVAQPA